MLGATQNQNESFNDIVWARCPKTGFCSVEIVEITVNLAAITFNHGFEGLSPLFVKLFGFPPCGFTANYLSSSGSKRVRKSVQKAEHTGQKRRKLMRSAALATEESHVAREGVTYESGGLWLLGGFFFFLSFLPYFYLVNQLYFFDLFSSLFFFIWPTNYIFLTGCFLFFIYLVNQLYFFDRLFSFLYLFGQPTFFF